jgi:hypothetical protein
MGPDELKRLNDLLANPELRDAVEKLIEDYRTTGKYRQDLVANVIRLVPEQDRASFKHALDIIATEATDPKNARFTVQMILGGVGIVVTLALFAYFGKGQIATWLRGTYNACRGVVASIFHKATQLVAGMRTAAPAAAPAAAPEPPAPAARPGWGWR